MSEKSVERPWLGAEDVLILNGLFYGHPPETIGERIDRTKLEVVSRLVHLGWLVLVDRSYYPILGKPYTSMEHVMDAPKKVE